MLSRTLPVALLLIVPLAACGGGDDEPSTDEASPSATASSSSPTTSATPAAASCDLLTTEQVTELAGEDLGDGRETTIAGELPACQWGELGAVGVQVGRVDASVWARSLPTVVAQLEASGLVDDDMNAQRLEDAAELVASGETIAPEQACELFGDLAEIGGQGKDARVSISLVPSSADPQAISAQGCRDGVYSTVLVTRPGLSDSLADVGPVQRALASVARPS